MPELDHLVLAGEHDLVLPDDGPARTAWMPISPACRRSVRLWRPNTYFLELRNTSLSASASSRAVPDGESFFRLWCFSTISMSNVAPSTAAACWISSRSRLMPSDMLAD